MDQEANLDRRLLGRRSLAATLTIAIALGAWLMATDASDIVTAEPPRTCEFHRGQRWAYTADSMSQVDANLHAMIGGVGTAAAPQLQHVPVRLQWRLDLEVLDLADGEADVQARWSEVTATGEKAVATGPDLQWPVIARIRSDCSVEQVAHHVRASNAAARTQQATILALSFHLPGATARRQTQVQTSIGTCVARHVTEQVDGQFQVARRLLRCTEVRGAPGVEAAPAIGHSTHRLDDGPWFAAMSGFERVVLRRGGQPIAGLQSKLKVTRAPPREAPLPAVDRSMFRWKLIATAPSQSEVAARQWPGLAGMSASDAVAELERLWGLGKGGEMKARDFARAWLQANPNGAGVLLKTLRDDVVDEHLRAAVYHVVGRFGGEPTRTALKHVLADSQFDDGDRSRAALAMAALPAADESIAEALIRASQRRDSFAQKGRTIGHSATLALGVLSHEQRARNPALGDVINQHLREAAAASDEGLAAEAISAIGNTADTSLLDVIEKNLGADSIDLRAKAAAATRLMDPVDTAQTVAHHLVEQTDARVLSQLAEAAAMALTSHKKPASPAVITAASEALKKTKSAATQRSIVKLLGAAGDNAHAKATLKALFERGAAPDTLRLIGMYLTADELIPTTNAPSP